MSDCVDVTGLWKLVVGKALVRLSDSETYGPPARRVESGVWEILATVDVIKAGGYADRGLNVPSLSRMTEQLIPVMPSRLYLLYAVIEGDLYDGYRGRWAFRVGGIANQFMVQESNVVRTTLPLLGAYGSERGV